MRALAALLVLASLALRAGEPGLPSIRNFTPKEYGASAQNWAFQEDDRGLAYVGNTAGVLEYDGSGWRLLQTRNRSCVRSLGKDASGRVFVGAKNEFGYLAPDASGRMAIVPLEDLVEPAARTFADVWMTLPAPEGVYFSTRDWLFLYDGKGVRSWKADTTFTLAWRVRGRLYLYERGVGPVRLGPAGLERLPGGEFFAKEPVNFMVPWGDGDGVLLGTARLGLFLWDGAAFRPLPTEADPFLKKCIVSCGALLGDGSLAVGGLSGGCVILDGQGRLLQHLDRKAGLQEDGVNRLEVDRRGRLWLELQRGLARVDWPSPFTAFGEEAGLVGNVTSLCRDRGTFYAGTSQGLFRLERAPGPASGPVWTFRKLEGLATRVWGFLAAGGRLLVGNSMGVYEVRGDRAVSVLPTGSDRDAFCLVPSRRDPQRVFVGLSTGLCTLRWNGTRWRDEGRVPGVKGEVRTLAEAEDGSLWLGTQSSGVFHVTLAPDWGRPGAGAAVEAYGPAQGLPGIAHDFVRALASGRVFTTHKGVYRFDTAARRFEPDPRFRALSDPPRYVESLVEGQGGKLWLHLLDEATGKRASGFATPGPDGDYRLRLLPWAPLADFAAYALLPEADGAVWLGGPDGLLRFDPAREQPLPPPGAPLVRRVSGPDHRTLFGGAGDWAGAGRLPYAANSLRFEFAAPGGGPEGEVRYQVRLEGYEREPSPWSSETFRDYTNLPEGRYRFLVRAREGDGQPGPEAAVPFRILAPFYRAWWAYLAYLAALGLLGHYLIQWRLRRSHRARRLLVRKVLERTEQLKARTRQLEQAKTAAEAATRAKSEFLANMSHEIRTPLNTILGYAELLGDEVAEPRHRDHLAAIRAGGKALLGIIGDILDLSKIEAGRMELAPVPTHLADLVEEVARTFSLRCRDKGLALAVDLDPLLPEVLVVSPVHLRQVLFNLLGNAVKFTERGSVTVRLRERAREAGTVDLALEVQDTGIGILPGQLGLIFEAFQQAPGQDASRYGGTGLGLAISRRLAGSMGGELTVASAPGEGSTFTLLLRGVAVASREDGVAGADAPFRGTFLPATVLLVDDVQPNRDLVKHYFAATALRFVEAADGEEGLRLAREVVPDLILMDVRMPGLDGVQATRRLKADDRLKAIPVLILTASTALADEGPVLASGAEALLRKPISRARLAAELARFLPCAPEPAADVPSAVPAPPGPLAPADRAALDELLALLDPEALGAWGKLKDAFFIERMTGFAARMAAMAERFREPGLKAWSEAVQTQAAAFDMEHLPGTFRRFPEVVEELRGGVGP